MKEGRTVRLLSCDLRVDEDITDKLLDYTLAWIWVTDAVTISTVREKGPYEVEPVRGMYDFGLDDEVPNDWLVWTEHAHKSVCVVHDLRILHRLGVRGNFVVNEVGTLLIEKWELTDNNLIAAYMHEVTFSETPDIIIPITKRASEQRGK